MNKSRILSQYRPVVFSVLAFVIAFLCMRVSGMLFKLFPVTPVVSILKHVVGMAWPSALAVLFGYGFIFQGKGVRDTLRPALPSFILRLFLLLSAVIMAFTDEIGSLNLYGALFLLVLHTAFTMYLLRKSKRDAVLARLEQERNEIQM